MKTMWKVIEEYVVPGYVALGILTVIALIIMSTPAPELGLTSGVMAISADGQWVATKVIGSQGSSLSVFQADQRGGFAFSTALPDSYVWRGHKLVMVFGNSVWIYDANSKNHYCQLNCQ